MGKRGPKPIPREILAQKGARIRKDRYPSKTVMTSSPGGKQLHLKQPIKPPRHLTTNAKKIWKEICCFLKNNHLDHEIFNGSLELYCYYLDQHQQMQKYIKKVGRTYTIDGKYGEVWHIRPEVKLMDEASKQVRSLAGDFGLTPSSFGQVQKATVDPQQGELWPNIAKDAG